jgi:hypothetical protein
MSKVDKMCICGNIFSVYLYRKDTAKFCSRLCADKNRIKGCGYKCEKGSLAKMGTKNPMYGKIKKNPSRGALHSYMHKRLDGNKPNNCQLCGEEKKLELSSIEHGYTRNPKDWQWLCKKCHHWYDGHEKYLVYGRTKKRKKRVSVKCLCCNKEMFVLESSLPRKKYCSTICRDKYSPKTQ